MPTESVTGATTTPTKDVTGMKANDDVTVGVAVIATYTVTKTFVKAPTTAMGIALLIGLHPDLLGLPVGAKVLDTMTTLDEILRLHRHHPTTTVPSGQTCRLRMVILGVSRKTCTEGTVGLMGVVTILRGKWASCIVCQILIVFQASATTCQ
jgi:hypothetical protein